MVPLASAAWEGRARDYPQSQVERPMTLPRYLSETSLEGNLTNVKNGAPPSSGYGGSLGAGVDVGLPRDLQVGAFFAFPLAPVGGFGDFIANLQATLVPRA